MPIKLNRIFALQNLTISSPFGGCKFKDEAFKNSPSFKIVPIEETVNFKALSSNNFEEYEKYIKEAEQYGRSKEKFLQLASDIKNLERVKISVFHSLELDKFVIIDGLHRICVCINNRLVTDQLKENNFDLYFDRLSIDFVEKEIKKTCGKSDQTNPWFNRTENGYHSFNIGNINLKGQRTPKKRIESLKKYYNFEGKTVLDLGCNNGGMLFHLTEIKRGVGLEFDKRCIDCANQLKKIFQFTYNLEFQKKDLNLPLDIKEEFDVAFLFSLGSWIKNWRGLYLNVSRIAKTIFLETNNDKEGYEQLKYMNDLGFKINMVSDNSKDDNTGNFGRKTYMLNR